MQITHAKENFLNRWLEIVLMTKYRLWKVKCVSGNYCTGLLEKTCSNMSVGDNISGQD